MPQAMDHTRASKEGATSFGWQEMGGFFCIFKQQGRESGDAFEENVPHLGLENLAAMMKSKRDDLPGYLLLDALMSAA